MADDQRSLDQRMRDAGMIPLEDFVKGNMPMGRFMVHAGIHNLDDFEHWLEAKVREYVRRHVQYELGEIERDDRYEWTVAHAAALHTALLNYRQAAYGSHQGETDNGPGS